MTHILILGGTSEASRLCEAVAGAGLKATLSYMGRVERPKPQPVAVRIGGFGGVEGLVDWLRVNAITHVVDATHPFAAQMSRNAVMACAEIGIPLVALTRPPWQAGPGDDWRHVSNMAGAVAALAGPPRRVMLAIGRMHLAEFAAQPQHHYLLRLVDEPATAPALPHHTVVVDRGPFSVEGDRRLMEAHGTQIVVSKNAGGSGSIAKLVAARELGLPVIMIDRPHLPPRREVTGIEDVLAFVGAGAHRDHLGV
jgi:precorrin-6A/cobalt-precorrin-6A reductase